MTRTFLIIIIGLTWFYSIIGFMFWDAYWILRLPTAEPLGRFIIFYLVSGLVVIAFLWRKK